MQKIICMRTGESCPRSTARFRETESEFAKDTFSLASWLQCRSGLEWPFIKSKSHTFGTVTTVLFFMKIIHKCTIMTEIIWQQNSEMCHETMGQCINSLWGICNISGFMSNIVVLQYTLQWLLLTSIMARLSTGAKQC